MTILSIEILIFSASMYLLYMIRKKKPNIFFLPKGITVFLPPEPDDLKAIKEYNKQQQKRKQRGRLKKPYLPLKIIKASSQFFSKIKFMDDLESIVLLTTSIIILIAASEAIRFFEIFPMSYSSPNLAFYLTLSLFFLASTTLFKISSIGGLEIYENRLSLIISILYCLLMTAFLFGAPQLIDINWQHALSKAIFHLRSVINSIDIKFDYLNRDNIFKLTLILMLPFLFSIIPSIIKFGNCYTNIMKDLYKEDDSNTLKGDNDDYDGNGDDNDSKDKQDNTSKEQENQEILPSLQESKKAFRWFNISLILNMIILFFWFKPLMTQWKELLNQSNSNINPDTTIDIFRCCFIIAHIFTVFMTYKAEISRYMARVYDSISTLLNDSSEKNLEYVRRKTGAHIQIMGSTSYQIAIRFIIPLLLLLLYASRSLAIREQKHFQAYIYNLKNDGVAYLDWNCVVIDNPKEIFTQFVTKCPKNHQMEIIDIHNGKGRIIGNEHDFSNEVFTSAKDLIRKINRYGLIHSELWYSLFSFWLFMYYLSVYALSLIYIIYKRKTDQSS